MQPERYRNRYRIASARLASWDYGSNGAYFITICTYDRKHAFGEVVGGEVHLTALGEAAWECWNAIPEHFSCVVLDAFVVMPNHIHGIIVIDKPLSNVDGDPALPPICSGDTSPSVNRFGPQS